MERMKKDKYLWLALLLGLTMMLVFMLPRLLDPYSLEEDFRNWYWMHLFHDQELFPNDHFVSHHVVEVTAGPFNLFIYKSSPLYGLLYQLLSNFLPFILIGKLQVFPLTVMAIYFLYRIIERFVSPVAAMTISSIFVLMNFILSSLVSMTGGLQRSFVLPLLLAFLYFQWQGRYSLVAIILLLSGGLYPPLFLLLAITCCLELVLAGWQARHTLEKRQYILYSGGILLVGLFVSLLLWPAIVRQFTAFTLALDISGNWALLSDGRYAPGGRATVFYIFPFVGRGGVADQGLTIIIMLFLALFAFFVYCWQPERLHNFPRIFKSLFWASWIAFGLAWLGFFLTAAFPLYLPSRYTQSSLLLVLFVFVMVHAPPALQAAGRWIMVNTAILFWFGLVVSGMLVVSFFSLPEPESGVIAFGRGASRWLFLILAALLLILTIVVSRRPTPESSFSLPAAIDARTQGIAVGLLLLLGTIIVWALQPMMNHTVKYHTASASERELYAYVQSLPKDIRISGSPAISDSIPIFGKRQVFLTLERLGPNKQATIDALLAYYADDSTSVIDFCERYDIDYLVIYKQDFIMVREHNERYFYEPYDSTVASQLGQQPAFFLETITDRVKSFQKNDISLVACSTDVLR